MRNGQNSRIAVEIYTEHGIQVEISTVNPTEHRCSECGKPCRLAYIRIGNTEYCGWHVPVHFTFSVDVSLNYLMYERERHGG